MALRPFLAALQESGRVRVVRPPEPPEVEREGLDELLAGWDRDARRELPFAPPAFSPAVAAWAAVLVYRGCQFLVYRDFGAEVVKEQLGLPCPEAPSAAVAYSADLTLRFLPDLLSLARGIAEGDALVSELKRLARAWPLSSVGVPDTEVDPSPFLGDPCLQTLYVDRIIERRDLARLGHPAIREAVRTALGMHSELCPEVAAALLEKSA